MYYKRSRSVPSVLRGCPWTCDGPPRGSAPVLSEKDPTDGTRAVFDAEGYLEKLHDLWVGSQKDVTAQREGGLLGQIQTPGVARAFVRLMREVKGAGWRAPASFEGVPWRVSRSERRPLSVSGAQIDALQRAEQDLVTAYEAARKLPAAPAEQAIRRWLAPRAVRDSLLEIPGMNPVVWIRRYVYSTDKPSTIRLIGGRIKLGL